MLYSIQSYIVVHIFVCDFHPNLNFWAGDVDVFGGTKTFAKGRVEEDLYMQQYCFSHRYCLNVIATTPHHAHTGASRWLPQGWQAGDSTCREAAAWDHLQKLCRLRKARLLQLCTYMFWRKFDSDLELDFIVHRGRGGWLRVRGIGDWIHVQCQHHSFMWRKADLHSHQLLSSNEHCVELKTKQWL